MKLNDRQIKNAKPAEKPFKLNDGKGLYLYINTSGGKLWRFDFSHNGKRKTLSIGKYPTVSLVEARQAAENARRWHTDNLHRWKENHATRIIFGFERCCSNYPLS